MKLLIAGSRSITDFNLSHIFPMMWTPSSVAVQMVWMLWQNTTLTIIASQNIFYAHIMSAMDMRRRSSATKKWLTWQIAYWSYGTGIPKERNIRFNIRKKNKPLTLVIVWFAFLPPHTKSPEEILGACVFFVDSPFGNGISLPSDPNARCPVPGTSGRTGT